jgi:glycosyltransferase involved in cell wall biosynthesis
MYGWADVLVLPSICEGSATVTYEAMACGLPVVSTPNTGSLVRHGVDGFVVPIRDATALQEKIELLCDDRALRSRMATSARERSKEGSLGAYGRRLLESISFGSS